MSTATAPAEFDLQIDPLDLIRHTCRMSFRYFVRHFWDQVPGAAPLIWNWHMDELCVRLQEVAERVFLGLPVLHDLIFNVPPGTSKSTICSILYPAWIWTRMPSARILSASHTNDLVMDLATKARAVIIGERYREYFPEIELTGDQDVKTYYRNTLGGDRYTCTVSGRSPMGFHAHFHLCDDLIDAKRAMSQVELIEARQFLTEILPTRKVDKAVTPCILIMQRLCPGDPTDVMVEASQKEGAAPCYRITLPAEESDKVFPAELRGRYVDGLLDPKRLSKAVLKRERARMANHAYEAQYGQNPVPPGGSMFKPAGFIRFVRSSPYECKRVFAVDRAATHNGGCATAGVLLAKGPDGRCYIEDVMWGQWEPDERNDRIVAAMLRYRRRYGKHEPRCLIEMERGSTGLESFRGIARRLAGFKVTELSVTGSKDVRAEPWADYVASGNVYIVDNGQSEGLGSPGWDVQGFIDEHIRFRPEVGKRLGGFKDRVDASSLGFNYLFNKRETPTGGPLRVLGFGTQQRSGPPVKFVVVPDPEELGSLVIHEPAILVYCCDPAPLGELEPCTTPAHALERLVASVVLPFADLQAGDLQDVWDRPLEGFNRRPESVLASKEVGRRLWGVLLRRHEPPPRFVLFTGEGASDGRPLSVAMAAADGLHYPRDRVFVTTAGADHNYPTEPPNKFAYDVFRSSKI